MSELISEAAPAYAPFFGYMGCAAAFSFSAIGSAIGTAKSGIGVAGIGTFRPDLVMKSIIPVILAGILSVYGLVVSVLIAGALKPSKEYTLFAGFMHLAGGLSVGLSSLAAGYSIGLVGDAGVRAVMLQPKVFVGMILILIFAEVLGLYGLIVALIANTRAQA